MIVWWNLSGLLGFFYDTPARDMIVGSRAKDLQTKFWGGANDGLFSEHLYLAHVRGRGMATEVHLDALPYIDHGYDEPGVREEV